MNFLRAFILISVGVVMMIIGIVGCANARYAGVEVTTTMEAFSPSTETPGQSQTPGPTATIPSGTGSQATTEPPISATDSASSESTPSAGATTNHVVQPGETLYSIARNYGIPVHELVRSNNILNPNHISAGTVLLIPPPNCDNGFTGDGCPPQNQTATATPTASPIPSSIDNFQADNTEQTVEAGAGNEVGSTTNGTNPPPIVTSENREIQVVVPENMTLGESAEVILRFNPEGIDGPIGEPGGSPEAPTAPNFETEFGQIRYYRDYNLFAVARLDSPGFNYSPSADVRRIVRPGEEVVYFWSIQPTEAEDQTFIISLWLEYEPGNPDLPPLTDGLNWGHAFEVEVRQTIFGLSASAERSISTVIGTGGIIPFFLGVLPLFRRKEQEEE